MYNCLYRIYEQAVPQLQGHRFLPDRRVQRSQWDYPSVPGWLSSRCLWTLWIPSGYTPSASPALFGSGKGQQQFREAPWTLLNLSVEHLHLKHGFVKPRCEHLFMYVPLTSLQVTFSRSFSIMISRRRILISLSVRSLSVGLRTQTPLIKNNSNTPLKEQHNSGHKGPPPQSQKQLLHSVHWFIFTPVSMRLLVPWENCHFVRLSETREGNSKSEIVTRWRFHNRVSL